MRMFVPSDLDEVNAWYVKRQQSPITAEILPKVGIIEPGVAAGFLYQTDSAIGFLEGFVANPDAPSGERHKALDAIIDGLIGQAKERGIRQVVGLTKHEGMEKRARQHGLQPLGTYVMLAMGI